MTEEPAKLQHAPYPAVEPKYGAKQQFVEHDETPAATKEDQKHVQKVTWKFNSYGRGVDESILVALSALASQQSKPTHATMQRVKQLLEYLASQDPAVVTYRKSGIILGIHSDAGYLNESKARGRAGGRFFLTEDVDDPPRNGAIHVLAEIIKAVMSSAAEAELGALYLNSHKGISFSGGTHVSGRSVAQYV